MAQLHRFPQSVLVAGCQRSGTTALARVITGCNGMVDYRTRDDDELDAALILSGFQPHCLRGRYCFQTTYLNERYVEYLDPPQDYKLIWVLRNPFSVVYSMKYNWESFAFNELFSSCGYPLLNETQPTSRRSWRGLRLSRTHKACLSYVGKQRQALELADRLGDRRMIVVDYDDLVLDKARLLPRILEWAGLQYRNRYAEGLHPGSVSKADLLPKSDRRSIEELCMPTYRRVRELAIRT